jgi:hypothetical protein
MGGMAQGIMALTAPISISGAPVWVHTIPVTMRTTQDHRSPMSHPLLPSLEFLTSNPNPFSPSPQLRAYPANYNLIFNNSERFN